MPTALTPSNLPEVFISYSHKDEEWLERLVVYLNALKNQKIITFWYGRRIPPGKEWAKEIDKHLSTAQVVLLLVSEDFLKSDYCFGIEFKKAMERHELETACVIPVILRECDWRDTPLGKLQALPRGAKPIVEWTDINEAFESISDGIKQVLTNPASNPLRITIIIDESWDSFDQEGFRVRLRDRVGVDLKRLTISVESGSVKISIEGDHEELARIVNALRDPECRQILFEAAKLKSITYSQDQREHSVPLEPGTPEKGPFPAEILRQAIRAVPAVKYALGVAGIAAAVAIVAGFSVDYKVAVLGTIIMFGLMFGLVAFSSIAFNSTATIRPLALFLAWTFVLLIAATSLCIFTSFFFDLPRPLEEYVRHTPSPSPSPLPTPSAIPTAETTPTSTPIPQTIRILITKVPRYGEGGPASQTPIGGKVLGVRPQDYRVVIYSLTGTWYVQPSTANPKTPIGPDGSWSAVIHTGTRYAILLVPPAFSPPNTTSESPTGLSGVVTSEEIEGKR